MKKKSLALVSAFLIAVFLMSLTSAAVCELNASLINQDPYPAIPGEYVNLVFQVNGIQNVGCSVSEIKFMQEFPFSLDPETSNVLSTESFYKRNYQSSLIAPFKVRVDREAIDGVNSVEVILSYINNGMRGSTIQRFNVEVEDKRSDFELYVKDYSAATNIITLEILNIGKADVKAVTLSLPKQENIQLKGANTNIVGDIDSNEYTTADFEVAPSGGNMRIDITYTDEINVRRSLSKTIAFEPKNFEGKKSEQKSYAIWYVLIILILAAAGWWYYRKYKRDKKKVY